MSDECIIHEKDNIGSFIFLEIWIYAALEIFIIDGYLIFFRGLDGIHSPFIGTLFTILTAAIRITIYHSIHKWQNKALVICRTAVEQEVHCTGQIVDAGMEIEGENYDTWDENDHHVQKRRYCNYWFDVDYRDPKS